MIAVVVLAVLLLFLVKARKLVATGDVPLRPTRMDRSLFPDEEDAQGALLEDMDGRDVGRYGDDETTFALDMGEEDAISLAQETVRKDVDQVYGHEEDTEMYDHTERAL
jgi:hypothetical protein